MRWMVLLVLVAPALAQDPAPLPGQKKEPERKAEPERRAEPEPGPVAIDSVELKPLRVPAVEGDADAALKAFVAAHEAHKRGDLDEALTGYLRFRGIAAARELPERYAATVRRRLDALLQDVRKVYDRSCRLYSKDRKKGLAALQSLAKRHPGLPEGRAALALWHTDGLHEAIEQADRLKADKKAAAAVLEKAIRRFTAGLRRYEAKSRLIELGGPDLFEPGERITEGDDPEEPAEERDEEEKGETTIESGDDDG